MNARLVYAGLVSLPKTLSPRKLLVAAIGIATVNYVAAACTPSAPPTSGNLPAPDPVTPDAATTQTPPRNVPPTSGNLPAPPPRDAGPG